MKIVFTETGIELWRKHYHTIYSVTEYGDVTSGTMMIGISFSTPTSTYYPDSDHIYQRIFKVFQGIMSPANYLTIKAEYGRIKG
jgi:hypothetical protein